MGPKLTKKEARGALVYCAIAFAVCAFLLRLILAGGWEGVVYTSTGQVFELKYFFALGAVSAAAAFVSMLNDAFPGIWRRLVHRR